jgi:hypothetical protein
MGKIMMEKYTNSVTCRRLHGLRLGASLIAVFGAIGVFSSLTTAAEEITADPCNEAVVTEQEARSAANSFLQEQGWAWWVKDTATTRFRIRKANCVNGQWRVGVTFSRRVDYLNGSKGVVLINCHSGAIELKSRSA